MTAFDFEDAVRSDGCVLGDVWMVYMVLKGGAVGNRLPLVGDAVTRSDDASTWDVNQVASYFTSRKLGKMAEACVKERITGAVLLGYEVTTAESTTQLYIKRELQEVVRLADFKDRAAIRKEIMTLRDTIKRPLSTFSSSNYYRAYSKAAVPRRQHDVFSAVHSVVDAFARLHNVPETDARGFFSQLEREAFHSGLNTLLDEVRLCSLSIRFDLIIFLGAARNSQRRPTHLDFIPQAWKYWERVLLSVEHAHPTRRGSVHAGRGCV